MESHILMSAHRMSGFSGSRRCTGRELAPPSWRGYKCPVVLVERALYGLPRSGEDWSALARRTLLAHAFEFVAELVSATVSRKKWVPPRRRMAHGLGAPRPDPGLQIKFQTF